MERLTIDEIIEHCERNTKLYEEIGKSIDFETIELTDVIKEYWERKQVKEYLEELKRYRDLEEQGLLLRLPCKVGDVIWDIDYGVPTTYEITGYSFGEADGYIDEPIITDGIVCYYSNSNGSITGSFAVSEIGKTVFLTKAEAEQKLKEMEDK